MVRYHHYALDENAKVIENWNVPTSVLPENQERYNKGKQLAKLHCGTCHEYVSPELLDRVSWPRVLNVMKKHMDTQGISVDNDDWAKTYQFYIENAAPHFYSSPSASLQESQSQFDEYSVENKNEVPISSTMLRYLDGTLYLGDRGGYLFTVEDFNLHPYRQIDNIPIWADKQDDFLVVLGIGSLMPSESKSGQLLKMSNSESPEVLVDSLKRPIHFIPYSSVPSEEKNYLISSFGSTVGNFPSGRLSSYNIQTKKETVVDKLPGATQAEWHDLDKDGHKELIALFSQANECLNIYKHHSEDEFSRIESIKFPAVYGTNSFDVADMNADGYLDVVITNGDNDDYSKTNKPYHGIRIFLNDGDNHFTKSYFHHVPGASKVKLRDFNKDGLMDFVVLAMYPDLFSRPSETLQYFENVGGLDFKPQYFELEPSANWILLEVADLNQDGFDDIITASNPEIGSEVPQSINSKWLNGPPIVIKIYMNKALPS